MSELVERLAALRALRASGERRVRFGDREIEYRNDAELAAAIADVERQIAAGAGQRVRKVRFHMLRG